MADSTPLLADFDDNDTPHIDTNNEEFETQAGVPNDPAPASSHFKRPIKILTIIILVCSIITVALLIANDIIVTYGPFTTYRWYIYDALNSTVGLGIFIFIALITSIINLRFNLPVLLNIIVDIILISCIAPWLIKFIDAWPGYNWCRPEYGYKPPGTPDMVTYPPLSCSHWKLVVRIIMGIAAGLGGIVGISHLVLLVLRAIALFRTKFWTKNFPWRFPTGQITFEFTIKVLRQESGAANAQVPAGHSGGASGGSGSLGVGAGTSSVRGPTIEA